ncbi:MAG: EFR1 family ferrodoxin [Clostridia bacterium]|nr:EFR1 family ferrodoxin [Clostridia bacterium]
MIFYFSGTGNSRYAAQKIAAMTGDRAYDIAEITGGDLPGDGNADVTGFIFPVYFSGLPEIVKRFASDIKVHAVLGTYVFSVITCGASPAAADKKLAKALGVNIDYSASLVMPDNYIVAYNPSSREKALDTLAAAQGEIDKICNDILNRRALVKSSLKGSLSTAFVYPLYGVFRTTRPFFADEKCVGCGKCESLCPDSAIKLKGGIPEWTKPRCQHCVACINSCPADAIQFGKKTAERNRYCIEKLISGK